VYRSADSVRDLVVSSQEGIPASAKWEADLSDDPIVFTFPKFRSAGIPWAWAVPALVERLAAVSYCWQADDAIVEQLARSNVDAEEVSVAPVMPANLAVSPELLSQCERSGVLPYLNTALALVSECFLDVAGMALEMQEDPEVDESWYSLCVRVRGENETLLRAFDAYTRLWVTRVPWPHSNRIRLSLDVLER